MFDNVLKLPADLNPDDAPVRRSSRLEALAGGDIVAFESGGGVSADTLLPGEAAMVADAVPKRVGEFAAGRACARAALAQLGIGGFELRSAADRSPLWPPGIVGSISHTDGFCGAAAGSSAHVLGLGLDAEARHRVGPDLWRRICTEEERRQLATLDAVQAAERATLIFSAKEAFYKAQYPLTRQWLNFTDVTVHVEAGHFDVVPQRPLAIAALRPAPWRGRLLLDGDLALTLVRMD